MPQQHSNTKIQHDVSLQEPRDFNVVFHNDDYTTMQFVETVLIRIYHKSADEANMLMLKVHHEGKAVVATYCYDLAMTKLEATQRAARYANYPLRVTIESV